MFTAIGFLSLSLSFDTGVFLFPLLFFFFSFFFFFFFFVFSHFLCLFFILLMIHGIVTALP